MIEIILALVAGGFLYWLFVLRPGRLDFWRVTARHPDAAFDHLKAASCWKVFEEGLPDNYRSIVPKPEWVGPFKLSVPKLGGRLINVFGKYPELEQSQNEFMQIFGNS